MPAAETETRTSEPTFLERLSGAGPELAAELRPPRAELSDTESLEAWIDTYHAVRDLARRDCHLLFTDDAVGASEEENLRHLAGNVAGDVRFSRLVPFLTCKHSLDYCVNYAKRAVSRGVEALAVVGGDRSVGPPRCVEHSHELRAILREEVPSLALGGWVNPHADPSEQVEYLARGDFAADFYLTQVVSHHHAARVEAFLEEADRRGVEIPGMFGVFFYRSANPRTLDTLGRFFPVPREALEREFAEGASPEEVCARSVRALRGLGVENVYLSNLGVAGAPERYDRVRAALEERPAPR